jgi:hypothetical protein
MEYFSFWLAFRPYGLFSRLIVTSAFRVITQHSSCTQLARLKS